MDPQDLKSRLATLTKEVEASDVGNETTAQARAALGARLDAIAAETDRDTLPVVRSSKDDELRDAAARLYRQLAMINSWLPNRDPQTTAWIDRAAELAATDVLRD